jgi:F-type H+-transporting ATPase subunit b
MRRLLLILVLLFAPLAFTQEHPQSGDVAHGAEKAAHETAHPDEAHGGEGEAPKTYFGIPAWILKLANMLLFLGVLVYFVRKPLKSAMAERRAAIRRAADEAKERRTKADQVASDIQARLTAIEGEVRAIHERAQAEGERQKRELVAAAEAEAAKILQTARNEVDNRLKHARHELTEYAGQLAAERAEQILREKINDDDQKRLFQDSLRQVSEVRS